MRNCLCLFSDDGRGSAAYIYIRIVLMMLTERYMMNGQMIRTLRCILPLKQNWQSSNKRKWKDSGSRLNSGRVFILSLFCI